MRDILINNILTQRLKIKFTDYIYDSPKKTQRPLNESKISDLVNETHPFYAVRLMPKKKTLKLNKCYLTDEGEDVVKGRADIMDYADGDTLLIDFAELTSIH